MTAAAQCRKDAKLDAKAQLSYLNEVAELHNCNNVLFFDARKRADLYLWLARAPTGPCVKFHIQNRKPRRRRRAPRRR